MFFCIIFMMKKNVAIIGIGKQGIIHLNAALGLRKKQKINLIAICDKNKNLVKEIGEKHNIDYFSNYKKLISKHEKKLDLLILALPNNIYSKIISNKINKKIL